MATMPPSFPTVAIIEDNTGIADLYEIWLHSDYTVDAANTCKQAESILDDTVDVALLDRRLPDGSGDELLMDIRNRGLTFPVAMVSGENPDLDIINLGFDAYHTKPIRQEELLETVQTLLEETEYGATKREFFAITRKKALLEAYRSEERLGASEKFTKLMVRHRDLKASVETQRGEFTENLQGTMDLIELDDSV